MDKEKRKKGSMRMTRVRRGMVRFQVQSCAITLKEFTMADLVRAANMNFHSVRSIVKQMQNRGLLINTRNHVKTGKKGGSTVIYHLTQDAEALRALRHETENLPLLKKLTLVQQMLANDPDEHAALLMRLYRLVGGQREVDLLVFRLIQDAAQGIIQQLRKGGE